MNHHDWVMAVEALRSCTNPSIQQIYESKENPDEEAILFLADKLDRLTAQTSSHDAAVEWASKEFGIPTYILSRVFYDDRTALGDLIRSKHKLSPLKRGRRTPLARFLALLHSRRYKNKEEWENDKEDLLSWARLGGEKLYRKISSIVTLADTPLEAKLALISLNSKRHATTFIPWQEETKINLARKLAKMKVASFRPKVSGLLIKAPAYLLYETKILPKTKLSEHILHSHMSGLRQAGFQIVDARGYDDYYRGPCATIWIRGTERTAQQINVTLPRFLNVDVRDAGQGT